MGDTIHQEALPLEAHCPIKALARRVHHILSMGGSEDTLICAFKESKTSVWQHVTAQNMVKTVRLHVKIHNLTNPKLDPDLIGAHSLRAGGAMALKLNGASDTTIMKLGRWSGLTFLMYIHTQIAHLSQGITTKMNKAIPFVNIAHF